MKVTLNSAAMSEFYLRVKNERSADNIICILADILERSNPQFNRALFLLNAGRSPSEVFNRGHH